MSFITIDQEKCDLDGICVKECPMNIIEMTGEKSPPTPTKEAEEKCILCGHCVAVCPYGALTHSRLPIEDFPPINKELTFSVEQAEQFLRSRRSVRIYKEKAVEPDRIERLIEIARHAPTGSNSQLVDWLVIDTRPEVVKVTGMVMDMMRQMIERNHPLAMKYGLAGFVSAWEQGADPITRGAPVLVLAHAPKEYGQAQVDCTAALTFLDLAAPALGLGTCWAGFVLVALSQYQPLVDALGLPEGHGVFGAMMVGYPRFRYHKLVPRNKPEITWKSRMNA